MYFEEFYTGQTFAVEPVTIERKQMMDFAALYDPIPLHLDEAYAKTTRYGGLIAPGMMSFMSVWAQFLKLRAWEESIIAGMSTHIEWLLPVYPGDTLRAQAEITALESRNPYNGMVEVTLEIYNQDGKHVMRDVTRSIVKKKCPG